MKHLISLRNELEQWMAEMYPGSIPVHGEGVPGCDVMLIGEAPGEQETIMRRPFVGKAGKNLDAFLQMAGIGRGELFVSNVVKMRPWKISAAGNVVNRPPTRMEIKAFTPWLLREIELVSPKVIVTLGNTPLTALTDTSHTVGEYHGKMITAAAGTLYPMYHPASVIYNRSLESVYCEDVYKLGEMLRDGKL